MLKVEVGYAQLCVHEKVMSCQSKELIKKSYDFNPKPTVSLGIGTRVNNNDSSD